MTQEYKISPEIYSLGSLQQAIQDFSDVAEIVFKNDTLSISGNTQDDIQEIFNEFMNYVLSL